MQLLAAVEKVLERGAVEDLGGSVADLLHDRAGRAGLDVVALTALHEGRLAHARQRRQRAVEHANHLSERDFARRLPERVAAAFSFLALKQPVILELEENELEELLRNLL